MMDERTDVEMVSVLLWRKFTTFFNLAMPTIVCVVSMNLRSLHLKHYKSFR